MTGLPSLDVIVVGGGPAGLSASLVLARCCRNVLLCDAGFPRNYASHSLHAFPTREDIDPDKFRDLARAELAGYESLTIWDCEVTKAERCPQGFSVQLGDGRRAVGSKMLLAIGLLDELPKLDGIRDFFGMSVFSCPYCDGFEVRGRPLGAVGTSDRAFEMALALTPWSSDIALITNGPHGLNSQQVDALSQNDIRIYEEAVRRLEGNRGQLRGVSFQNGDFLERAALFFDTSSYPQSNLAQQLGCQFDERGKVCVGKYMESATSGVFVAGNLTGDVQLALVAAADGARAAFGINKALTQERFWKMDGRRHAEGPELNA